MNNQIKKLLPKGFLWKLTFLNVFVIVITIVVISYSLYNTACFLFEGIGSIEKQSQQQFNATLLQYLWIYSLTGIFVASVFHFYFTKRLIKPVKRLIESTKKMKKGEYPEAIQVESQDEIGELVGQYNGLIEQLRLNESMRNKLVTDLAHEIRTPLANLNGYLHALKDGVIRGENDLYRSLYEESNRLTLMVEQLEEIKKWDFTVNQFVFKRKLVNIATEISQCVAMFEWKILQESISVEIDASSKRMNIYVEGFHQVLSNLIDNSIRYYQGPGEIIVKGEQLEGAYQVSVIGPSDLIEEGHKQNIFERFYRMDASRNRETGGTGLGLAIAKTIVKHHNGEIGVKPMGNYNEFWFTIPYKNV